jgi:hypothetical protein
MPFSGRGRTAEEGASGGFEWGIDNNANPKPNKNKLNQKIFLTRFPFKFTNGKTIALFNRGNTGCL